MHAGTGQGRGGTPETSDRAAVAFAQRLSLLVFANWFMFFVAAVAAADKRVPQIPYAVFTMALLFVAVAFAHREPRLSVALGLTVPVVFLMYRLLEFFNGPFFTIPVWKQ